MGSIGQHLLKFCVCVCVAVSSVRSFCVCWTLYMCVSDMHSRRLNYRMAQPTKWVPAILDYMKKVRLNISTVVLLSELEISANTTVDM